MTLLVRRPPSAPAELTSDRRQRADVKPSIPPDTRTVIELRRALAAARRAGCSFDAVWPQLLANTGPWHGVLAAQAATWRAAFDRVETDSTATAFSVLRMAREGEAGGSAALGDGRPAFVA